MRENLHCWRAGATATPLSSLNHSSLPRPTVFVIASCASCVTTACSIDVRAHNITLDHARYSKSETVERDAEKTIRNCRNSIKPGTICTQRRRSRPQHHEPTSARLRGRLARQPILSYKMAREGTSMRWCKSSQAGSDEDCQR